MITIPVEKLKGTLVEQGLIAPEKFDVLAEDAARMNQDIGDVLISQRFISKDYLYSLMASYFGVQMASLGSRGIDRAILLALDQGFAQERKVIAFSRDADGTINLAMEDPTDLATIEFLERKFGARVRPYLATQQDLARGYSLYSHEVTEDFKKLIEGNIHDSMQQKVEREEEAAKQIHVVDLVNNIMSYATYMNASDVHIEALEDSVLVRFRVDGILHEIMSIPKQVQASILARIKLLSALKVDEHMKPQDGRFRQTVGQETIDVRVSIIPTMYGEKIVMRLLAAAQRPLSLSELGVGDEYASIIEHNIRKSYGMVLVTGPTGSGKSTTLYSVLNMLNRPEVNIVTVEDPIEYNIKYINQIQINPLAGITFASGLRSILRQDPNVIMVGEIRDEETAEIAVQAALTGHILLSSLHTNDAISTIARLIDMKIPPFLVAAVLNVSIAQRLVRKICIDCIESYVPDQDFVDDFYRQVETHDMKRIEIPKQLYRGKGCKACNGSGYRGRLGIFEIVEVTDDVRRIIARPGFALTEIEQLLQKNGYKTMFEDGMQKVALGQTTIEEVLRVIRE
jgi:type IV pilus assembly protein PilB